jgi:hypothetical protein
MAEQKKDRDTAAETFAESIRDTGRQSGETGGPDADTPAAPDFSFVSGATGGTGQPTGNASGQTPSDSDEDTVRRAPKDRNA